MKVISMLCKWLFTFLLTINRHILGLPLWEWWEWRCRCWLGLERENRKEGEVRERPCLWHWRWAFILFKSVPLWQMPQHVQSSSQALQSHSHKLEYFAFYHFSPRSIFAKGVSKLGYMGQALMETYGSRIFLESNNVNFYLHPKPNCSEVTVVKTVFSRKTLPYSKEREREKGGKKKRSQLKK